MGGQRGVGGAVKGFFLCVERESYVCIPREIIRFGFNNIWHC